MKLRRTIQKLLRRSHLPRRRRPAFGRIQDEMLARTRAFASARSIETRSGGFLLLFRSLWTGSNERAFTVRLLLWIRLLERNDRLRLDFQENFQAMLGELESRSLLTEAGLPVRHALFAEGLRRLFQKLLPSARSEADSSRLVVSLFSTPRDVERFLDLPQATFERLRNLCFPAGDGGSTASAAHLLSGLRQALRLLALRTAGRGVSPAILERRTENAHEDSPFFHLHFATDALAEAADPGSMEAAYQNWAACVQRCREDLEIVHQTMERAGVSADLMLDLRSIEMNLTRMSRLADVLAGAPPAAAPLALRELLNQLIAARLEDKRISSLLRQNLTLLARKTVERTGRSGEHYIATNHRQYLQMWAAALGGGLLTVFTVALKLRIVAAHFPPFIDGLFSGTNYAVSFILLQVFGLTLATKQPSATAATLAGIVRRNRGVARWSKIADFTALITRTQLATAIGNIVAVCVGAVALERLWRIVFSQSYLPARSARRVYETLHPFTSGTAFYAALTGVILWLAALIGGWCENFALYHRIAEAVSQHPYGFRLGRPRMQAFARWLEANLEGWSASIALGYLLGFTPAVGDFFGIPLDVRHVTLTTGTLALAAARYGASSFGHHWFYFAVAGIGITFVLNLGVSFSIASFVALRAYDVGAREQLQLLRYVLGRLFRSPLKFLLPLDGQRSPDDEPSEIFEKR
jgi:site-specific recombinase